MTLVAQWCRAAAAKPPLRMGEFSVQKLSLHEHKVVLAPARSAQHSHPALPQPSPKQKCVVHTQFAGNLADTLPFL